ncbi:hypothetical protein SISSUDRAFT_1049588 [Sistotremastrum suecicum HHB10207 ss-3]|uniref:Solute carrier family 40 member n=1 Tax=Sistotremastrum suecicum HHB10207 ss-3 TaxID=1314776 RepID=A0A166BR25_9AGAM|nr:hypothetical protein SISSUDRAFT_1049588 [Sistotremastrum suecicum HHB10207 ss-3]
MTHTETCLEENCAHSSVLYIQTRPPSTRSLSTSSANQNQRPLGQRSDQEIQDTIPDQETPLLQNGPRRSGKLDGIGLVCYALQHVSSTWAAGSFSFASYLFLADIFKMTLLPSAVLGFVSTGCACILSGETGKTIDKYPRLAITRFWILLQKLAGAIVYAFITSLFYRSQNRDLGSGVSEWDATTALTYGGILFFACILNLSTVGVLTATERDWPVTIAARDTKALTRINLIVRRIDLFSKLFSPMVVTLFTATIGNQLTALVLLFVNIATAIFELIWIKVVYNRFPNLAAPKPTPSTDEPTASVSSAERSTRLKTAYAAFTRGIKAHALNWKQFTQHSVFLTSLSISFLYLTVLSFDGNMIVYLKSRGYSDAFIAAMRGLNVLTGLLGTVVMPLGERKLGLVRTGSWAIWSEAVTLIPVVVSLFLAGQGSASETLLTRVMLFGGMAASRIGLWTFDLVQLTILQRAFGDESHTDNKNALMSLQFSLQNMGDLLKYVIVISLSRPDQFKYAALMSAIAVLCGAVLWLAYAKRERGHIIHAREILEAVKLKKRR